MKQSGFDGLVVATAIVLATGRRAGRPRLRELGLLLGGAALPLGASALHGLLTGWHEYWYAVVGYKLGASSGTDEGLGTRLARLGGSLLGARRDLEYVAAIALAGLLVTLQPRTRLWVPALWLVAAFAGFNTASLYWGHYYVQLIAPLAPLAGI